MDEDSNDKMNIDIFEVIDAGLLSHLASPYIWPWSGGHWHL